MGHTSPPASEACYGTMRVPNPTVSIRHVALVALLILSGCSGGGGSGGTSSPTAPTVAPDMPSGVAITIEPTALNVMWNAVSGASNYRVYYSETAGVTASSPSVTVNASPATITGLTEGTTYYVRVSAEQLCGQ